MHKNLKIALLVSVPIVVIAAVGGGALYLTRSKSTASEAVLSANTGSGSTTLDPNAGIVNIPLTQAQPAPADDPDQLHVNTNKQSIKDGTLQQNQLGGGSANGGGSSAAGSGSTATAKVPGPETFKQYDQYKDGQHAMFGEIQVGTGLEVTAKTKVAVLYKGWLTDGSLFDQSRTDNKGQLQPFVLTIGEHTVITGWEEGLVGMKVGGIRRIIVPPAVGYGPQGHDPIPGNVVLVFDVQLLDAQ